MKPHPESLERQIDAAIESSRRTRWTLIVGLFASVVLLASSLANRPWYNWPKERLTLASEFLKNKLSDPHATSDTPSRELELSLSRASDLLMRYQERFDERMDVNVPLFDVTIDVNDLGLIGGLAMILIAAMLYAAVRRELDNTRHLFGTDDHHQLCRVFQVLAMHQVMNPVQVSTMSRSHVLSHTFALGSVLMMPMAFLAWTIVNGYGALFHGPSAGFAPILIAIDLLVLVALAVIGIKTLSKTRELHAVWSKAASECHGRG